MSDSARRWLAIAHGVFVDDMDGQHLESPQRDARQDGGRGQGLGGLVVRIVALFAVAYMLLLPPDAPPVAESPAAAPVPPVDDVGAVPPLGDVPPPGNVGAEAMAT